MIFFHTSNRSSSREGCKIFLEKLAMKELSVYSNVCDLSRRKNITPIIMLKTIFCRMNSVFGATQGALKES